MDEVSAMVRKRKNVEMNVTKAVAITVSSSILHILETSQASLGKGWSLRNKVSAVRFSLGRSWCDSDRAAACG